MSTAWTPCVGKCLEELVPVEVFHMLVMSELVTASYAWLLAMATTSLSKLAQCGVLVKATTAAL